MERDDIIEALYHIDPDIDYADWMRIGAALKHSGYDFSVFDAWSSGGRKYSRGECRKKWSSFNSVSSEANVGTIVYIAKQYGFLPEKSERKEIQAEGHPLEWDDFIGSDNGRNYSDMPADVQLKEYINALFKPDEYVAYITSSYKGKNGKWQPANRYWNRAAELLKDIDKRGDIGDAVGDSEPEAGAWICINPMDGNGAKDENVTDYRYTLVECDELPPKEQEDIYRRLKLPIAAMVYSGGKSVHAVVKVFAKNREEYNERVNILYDYLDEHGCKVDRANRNPGRTSRMPGIMRGGVMQQLLAVNIGMNSWDEWAKTVGLESGMLETVDIGKLIHDPPPMREEVIKGILRMGHKAILTGGSKTGKTFLLLELAAALASGGEWLGFECRKSRVLYVNFEIDEASIAGRLKALSDASEFSVHKLTDEIKFCNLKGKAKELKELTGQIIVTAKACGSEFIIIDPIYKIMMGDENNATDMGKFCNEFDRISRETGAAIFYCHHHSKGAQGMKKAQDRGSGSGVFSRDADAIIDMTSVEVPDNIRNMYLDDSEFVFELEASLREFRAPKPFKVIFNYPIHYRNDIEEIEKLHTEGSVLGNLSKSGKRQSTLEDRINEFENAYEMFLTDEEATQKIGGSMWVSAQCIADYLDDIKDAISLRTNRIKEVNRNIEGYRYSTKTVKGKLYIRKELETMIDE